MGGTAQIRLGDMFAGPSDLVVVPCSTGPTISDTVARRLHAYNLPEPSKAMRLGEVQFLRLTGAENVATWIAFAASVKSFSTSSEALEHIGRELGRFAAHNLDVRSIAAPLLGAAAGGMAAATVVAALQRGFLSEAPEHAVLNIFVLHKDLYERLVDEFSSERPDPVRGASAGDAQRSLRQPIRLLISYTKTSAQHAEWVKALATYLRSNGIDARLDVWHLRPGMDVAQWMCNELDLAERVLLICNEEYARRADGRHGGVGWEIRLVQGDLLMHQSTNPDKYIPVVCTETAEAGLPTFLKTTYFLHWSPERRDDEQLQEQLVKLIYRKAEEAPPLGTPPAYVLR